MTPKPESNMQVKDFIANWTENHQQTRKAFLELKSLLDGKPGVTLQFIAREGLTYSFRAAAENQDRPLFVMIDVIEDDPRWLSVCFYGDMISDPEEKGDFVPGGLLGEDGHCFDVDEYDPPLIKYLESRIEEAYGY